MARALARAAALGAALSHLFKEHPVFRAWQARSATKALSAVSPVATHLRQPRLSGVGSRHAISADPVFRTWRPRHALGDAPSFGRGLEGSAGSGGFEGQRPFERARTSTVPPRYIERPAADMRDANTAINLPYGMDAAGVVAAVNDLYAYLHAINAASIEYGYERLEDIQLRAAFSGLVSEIMVRSLATSMANRVPGLARNLYPNGHPDLVPRATYPGDAVQNGDEGVEVKAARNPTSIQAHNTGEGWYAVIEFSCDVETLPVYDREPTIIRRVRVAYLEHSDWSFSGRSATSRRTPTASITKSGRSKLDGGTVYVRGGAEGYAEYARSLRAVRQEVAAPITPPTPRERHEPPPDIEP